VAGQLRIIGGDWRGRRLRFAAGPGLRPTADRNRETVFNWLQGQMNGARVLDLFAGSGALGLEALSRGAARAVFVEHSRGACRSLEQNIATLDAAGRAEVFNGDARRFLRDRSAPFDVIFLDPPFAAGLLEPALVALATWPLPEHSRIYVEAPQHPAPPALPAGWAPCRERSAGAVWFALLRPMT
jgi:16S rRNA (guanine966-N2)-methyltransferase